MATHTLKVPTPVGDLSDGTIVDKLELVSVSINFHPANKHAAVSCMLRHPASGWQHTVTLAEHAGHSCRCGNPKACRCKPVSKGALADDMWEAIKKEFPDFEKKILTLLTPHLPAGTIS